MSPKISVIIPVHDTEKYLRKCVQSVLDQTFDDFEVICVDDMSPDGSADIISSFMKVDSRVVAVSHTENLGQGGARNSALKQAKGRYIANVDSDDWLKPTMLEAMYESTQGESVDIVCCGYDRVNEVDDVLRKFQPEAAIIDNSNNSVDIFELVNPALWNKLFRKDLCSSSSIEFPNYLCYEDLATTPRLVCESNTISIIDDRLYNYVSRENSVVSTYGTKHMLDCFEAFYILRDYLRRKNLLEHYQNQFLAMVKKHLRFRIKTLMKSGFTDEQKHSHLRYYAYLKAAMLDHSDLIGTMDAAQLQESILAVPSEAEAELRLIA